MPITHENVTTVAALLTALRQRHDTIQQLANQLAMPVIWRSVDGSLSVPIAPAEIAQLEDFVKLYLDESQVIHSTLRAILAKP
jgi:hypothetical protein